MTKQEECILRTALYRIIKSGDRYSRDVAVEALKQVDCGE